jgi:hypothetical protein
MTTMNERETDDDENECENARRRCVFLFFLSSSCSFFPFYPQMERFSFTRVRARRARSTERERENHRKIIYVYVYLRARTIEHRLSASEKRECDATFVGVQEGGGEEGEEEEERPRRRRRVLSTEERDADVPNAPLHPSSLADTSPPLSLPVAPPILFRRRQTAMGSGAAGGVLRRRFIGNRFGGLIASMISGLNESESGNNERQVEADQEDEEENEVDEDMEALARMLYIWRTMEQTARDFDRISASYYHQRSERGRDEVEASLPAETQSQRAFSSSSPPPISLFRRDASSARTTTSPPSFLSAASNFPTLTPLANGGGFVLRFPQALVLAMGSSDHHDFTSDDYGILVALDSGGGAAVNRGIPADTLDEQCPSRTFRNVEMRRQIEKDELPDPCVICLEVPKSREKVRQMPACKHVFHSNCVERWLENHRDCPCCKTPVLTSA